jgi:hypothetical protein
MVAPRPGPGAPALREGVGWGRLDTYSESWESGSNAWIDAGFATMINRRSTGLGRDIRLPSSRGDVE